MALTAAAAGAPAVRGARHCQSCGEQQQTEKRDILRGKGIQNEEPFVTI